MNELPFDNKIEDFRKNKEYMIGFNSKCGKFNRSIYHLYRVFKNHEDYDLAENIFFLYDLQKKLKHDEEFNTIRNFVLKTKTNIGIIQNKNYDLYSPIFKQLKKDFPMLMEEVRIIGYLIDYNRFDLYNQYIKDMIELKRYRKEI